MSLFEHNMCLLTTVMNNKDWQCSGLLEQIHARSKPLEFSTLGIGLKRTLKRKVTIYPVILKIG